ALKIDWDAGTNASVNSDGIRAQYRTALDGSDWLLVHSTGDRDILPHSYPNRFMGDASVARAPSASASQALPTIISEEYESQFLAHATMEPMNCTAQVTPNRCDVWAPTQGQELAQI